MKQRAIFRHLLHAVFFAAILTIACAPHYHQAKIINKPPLEYPLSAQMEGREGEVILDVYVSQDSIIKDLLIESSSGHSDLDSAALQFARNIQYLPAMENEQSIPSWTRLKVGFHLDKIPYAQIEWLREIKTLYKRLETLEEEDKRKKSLENLYRTCSNLLGSATPDESPGINKHIRKIVTEPVYEYWQPLEKAIPLSFIVMEDYIHRYPSSPFSTQAKARLLDYMKRLEDKTLGSAAGIPRIQERKDKILELLKQRIEKLENDRLSRENFSWSANFI